MKVYDEHGMNIHKILMDSTNWTEDDKITSINDIQPNIIQN